MAESEKKYWKALFAYLLVIVATVAVFLVMTMPWLVTSDGAGRLTTPASGWTMLAQLTGDPTGLYSFAGWFGIVVVIVAMVAGAAVLLVAWPWVCGLMATALALLAVDLLFVDLRFGHVVGGVQLAGSWAVLPLLLCAAVAWGNLAGVVRERRYETA